MWIAVGRALAVSTLSALAFACVSPTKGDTGDVGPEGPAGDVGPAGPAGDVGPEGPAGDVGPAGPSGDTGERGADAEPCTVVDNHDETMTITCPGSGSVTVHNGEAGADGLSCTARDNGDGSQTVNCNDGTHIYIQPEPIDPYLDLHESLPGLVATLVDVSGGTGTDGNFVSGDTIKVTFSVKNAAGRSIPLDQLDRGSAWFSGPTTNYQHVLPAARDKSRYDDVKTGAVYNGDGTYTYTFPDPIPATFGAPLYDTAKFTAGELTGALTAGTYTVTLNFYKTYYKEGREVLDAGHITKNVLLGDATTETPREVVTDANCNRCHDDVQGHEGRYHGVEMCVTCHTAGAEDRDSVDTNDPTDVTIDFKVMAHKLHNAAHLPSVLGVATKADDPSTTSVNEEGQRDYAATKIPYMIGDEDFSGIVYPAFPNFSIAMPKDVGYSTLAAAAKTAEDTMRKGVTSCGDCHGDPDGAGAALAPTQGGQAYSHPTRATCGSCHDDIDWTKKYTANGQTMPKNVPDEGTVNCTSCHTAETIQLQHVHPILDTTLQPQASFEITAVGGGTGPNGQLLAGDRPTVTFALKADGSDYPLTAFTSVSLGVTGPSNNRQVVIPGALTGSPFDFAGRLASSSTSGKGVMGKAMPSGATTSETITVEFTSATDFDVTGKTTGDLGSGTLPASTSKWPSGASFSNIVTTGSATAQALTIAFGSDTGFSVKAGTTVIGTGTLAANKSTVTRFVSYDSTVQFNLTVGTNAFAAGDVMNLVVFKGNAANPVTFAIIAGSTAFAAGDRFYYDYVAPAPTYTVKVPMDITLEYLGTADGSNVLTAANAPVWYGRQSLYELTAPASNGASTFATAATGMLVRHMAVDATTNLAANDYVLVDGGKSNAEVVQVSAVDATAKKLTFKSPLRWTHAANAAVVEVVATFRQEGTDYTLDATTGKLTLAATSANAFAMTYRTDGRFGWKRSAADTLQTVYFAPLDTQEKTDETWGDWRGKGFVEGTYTFALWGYVPLEYGVANEWQTYRGTTKSSRFDVVYAATAKAVEPYALIDNGENCNACHRELSFHGGGREGGDTCLVCHATAGSSVHYNMLLHNAHAETYPVMPNGAAQCTKCHGTADVWQAPTNRNHPTQQVKAVRDWSYSCTGCHSDTDAVAHTDVMTAPSGNESCEVCHGEDGDFAVRLVHQVH